MSVVKIADLKNNLSRHLDRVRRGQVLTVLDRDTPIARILPFVHGEPGAKASEGDRVADLARHGLLTPGDPNALARWVETYRPVRRPDRVPAGSELVVRERRKSTR